MSSRATEADSRYGWVIVGTSFLLLFHIWGIVFTFTVYSSHFTGEFGLSRIAASTIYSTGLLGFFIGGGITGIVTSFLRLRPVLVVTTVLLALGLAVFQMVTTFAGLALAFVCMGAAMGGTFVLVLGLVPQWFERRSGLAMGITQAGAGSGLLVMPLVWRWLLGRLELQTAFLTVGGLLLVLALVAAGLFRRPREYTTEDGSVTSIVDRQWLLGAFDYWRFWAAFAGLGLIFTWYFVLSDQLVDVLTAADVGVGVASAAFGLIGGVSIFSRIGSGIVADRQTPRVTLTMCTGLVVIGSLLLLQRAIPAVMYAAIACFGVGYGGIAALYSPILVRSFSPENAATVMGLFVLSEGLFGFVTPPAASFLAGAYGYDALLVAIALLTALGGLSFWFGTARDGVLDETDPGTEQSTG
jgi:OFA family oxalate/formate antiporter-like MFS transporter